MPVIELNGDIYIQVKIILPKARNVKNAVNYEVDSRPARRTFSLASLDFQSRTSFSIVQLCPHIHPNTISRSLNSLQPLKTMDPNFVDEDEESAAMAAMMGFSGFGSQKPPPKKRKFMTDAFVEGQEPSLLVDKGGKRGQGSGGNTMPLGKTRVFGTASSSKAVHSVAVNDSEIALDEDDEEDGPQYVDTSLPPPILASEDPPRQYFEPPPGVSDEEAKEMQSRIDVRNPSTEMNDY